MLIVLSGFTQKKEMGRSQRTKKTEMKKANVTSDEIRSGFSDRENKLTWLYPSLIGWTVFENSFDFTALQ